MDAYQYHDALYHAGNNIHTLYNIITGFMFTPFDRDTTRRFGLLNTTWDSVKYHVENLLDDTEMVELPAYKERPNDPNFDADIDVLIGAAAKRTAALLDAVVNAQRDIALTKDISNSVFRIHDEYLRLRDVMKPLVSRMRKEV